MGGSRALLVIRVVAANGQAQSVFVNDKYLAERYLDAIGTSAQGGVHNSGTGCGQGDSPGSTETEAPRTPPRRKALLADVTPPMMQRGFLRPAAALKKPPPPPHGEEAGLLAVKAKLEEEAMPKQATRRKEERAGLEEARAEEEARAQKNQAEEALAEKTRAEKARSREARATEAQEKNAQAEEARAAGSNSEDGEEASNAGSGRRREAKAQLEEEAKTELEEKEEPEEESEEESDEESEEGSDCAVESAAEKARHEEKEKLEEEEARLKEAAGLEGAKTKQLEAKVKDEEEAQAMKMIAQQLQEAFGMKNEGNRLMQGGHPRDACAAYGQGIEKKREKKDDVVVEETNAEAAVENEDDKGRDRMALKASFLRFLKEKGHMLAEEGIDAGESKVHALMVSAKNAEEEREKCLRTRPLLATGEQGGVRGSAWKAAAWSSRSEWKYWRNETRW